MPASTHTLLRLSEHLTMSGASVYRGCTLGRKKDAGYPYKHRHRWTSFVKSRINCSFTGEYPFYFDEISEWTCLYLSSLSLEEKCWPKS